ncbi:ABC transporter permease [Pseudoflavonifractor capillosus]|uniref:ABC transporter permease n=1 Tax=Pseudoflavonifractor capillosus TaxID=106588 RepID=UPI001958D835|nr:ABC transporter permease [Pseudoflavonifractor capillosus]MBM6897540.1 ABC transporter permease [Pseudoflavonifractor capillosus]
MTARIRFIRRPGVSVLWLVALTAAALLLAVGSGVLWSVIGLRNYMDEHFISVAVLTRTEEQMEELENSMAAGGLGLVLSAPVLTQQELGQIAAMPQVRMVDMRGLTAAYSPSLRPVSSAETEKAYQMDLDAPYNRVMLVARVIQADTTRTPQEMDTTELDGQVHAYTEVRTRGKLAVEQVIAAHEAYDISKEIDLDLLYVSEDPEDDVQEGGRYLFYGTYDAGLQHTLLDEIYESAGQQPAYAASLQVGDGVPLTANYLQEDGTYCFVSSGDIDPRFPSFAPILGDIDEFFADPAHELWHKTREEMEITLHSVPMMGTECLESVYAFQQGSSYMVEGRSFNQEEYRKGAPVCVVSEAVARASGLSVGDSLTISQYEALMNYGEYSNLGGHLASSGHLQRSVPGGSTELNNPFIRPYLSQYGFATQEETFTVVGIYRQDRWWDSSASFAMTPNVMFAPSKALADCAYQGDAGGVYLSVVLENGTAQDFGQATGEQTTEGRWLVDDQNYIQVQAGVEQLQSAAQILMAACVLGWGVIVLFYLVLYQGGERRNLGIMISVGAGKRRAVRYLVSSGLILAVAGTVLGLALSRAVDQTVLDIVMSVSMEQVSATAMSSASQVDTQLIAKGLTQGSAASWQGTALVAGLSLMVLGAAMLLQTWLMSRRRPRKLMEG